MMKSLVDYRSRFRILKGGKISLVVSALIGSTIIANASPTGGTVTSGTATINQSGTITNINQATNKASINWQDFSIKANETVNFNQPNASSITLNRVIGNERSIINGALNANGQVWILNSNGVLFGKNASINTSGLLATTAQLSDSNFNAGNYTFENSTANTVVNLGTIEVANNGSVVLASNEVRNEGTIKAVKGKVHLVGADSYSLNLNGNSLVSLTVEKGVLDALVENSGTISASGGEIYLTTNAVNELLKGVVNNTGVVEANSMDGLTGKVVAFAHGGEIQTGGSFSAKDGFVETSGKEFTFNDAKIEAGEWLIDPVNITVDATLSSTIVAALDSADVTIDVNTGTGGTNSGSGTNGDITVNSAISWATAKNLTLYAERNIILNADITSSNNGNLNLYSNTGGVSGNGGISLTGGTVTFKQGADSIYAGVISGTGNVLITGGESALFGDANAVNLDGFLTTTAQTIATNTTVSEVLERLSSGRMNGASVNDVDYFNTPPAPNHAYTDNSILAGVYNKSYDASTNEGVFQVKMYLDAGTSNQYTKVVFAKLTQSGNDVQVQAYNGNKNADRAAVYARRDVRSTDFTTAVSNGISLATSVSSPGYGVDRLFTSSKLTFTGANTYSGTTTIKNTVTNGTDTSGGNTSYYTTTALGTLRLGNSGTTGSLENTSGVINNGVLFFDRSNDYTLNAAISGTGNIVKQNSNTVSIVGAHSYTGSTTINDGTFVVEQDLSDPTTSNFNGTGKLIFQPNSDDFSSAFNLSTMPFSNSLTGLTIGKTTSSDGTSDVDVTLDNAVAIAGNVNVYGKNITINNTLNIGTNTVTLDGSGTVTDGASGYITAANLLLFDGAVTLDHTSNDVDTIAASGTDSLSFLDSNNLIIGTVGSTDGISSSGAIDIATNSADLTIAKNVTTTDTGTYAIVLNAGKSTAAGIITGGDLKYTSGTLSTGTGGKIKLFSGSNANSTGISNLATGASYIKTNAGEVSADPTTATTDGVYTIFRETNALTPIYLRLISGNSDVGDTPSFTYAYFDSAIGGNQITDANPSGTITWNNAPTSSSTAGTYSMTYNSGISLGNSSYALLSGDSVDWILNALAQSSSSSSSTTAETAKREIGAIINEVLANNSINIILPQTNIASVFNPSASSINKNTKNLVSKPVKNANNKLITMSEAKARIKEKTNQVVGELRVPIGENSVINLVNGGVNLPSGLEQLFFVLD